VQVASAAISVRIHQHLFVAWLLPATLLPLLLLLLAAAVVVVLFHAMRQLQSTTFNNQLVRCQMTLGPAKQWRVPAEIIFSTRRSQTQLSVFITSKSVTITTYDNTNEQD